MFPSGATTPNHIDSTFRPLIIRALRYYQKMLNDLTTLHEGEESFNENDPFGFFFVNDARRVGEIAQELTDNPHNLEEVIKEDRYRPIVYQALAYFAAELKRKGTVIQEELEGSEREEFVRNVIPQFNRQISRAHILMNKDVEDNYF